MAHRTTLRAADREFTVEIGDGGYVTVDDAKVRIVTFPDGSLQIEQRDVQRAWAVADGDLRWVFIEGRTYVFEVRRQAARRRRGGAHHGSLTAPMPATVRRIDVKPGDRVGRGRTLMILEAMKMELPVRATADGTIEAVNCREGELVQPGTSLVEIDEA